MYWSSRFSKLIFVSVFLHIFLLIFISKDFFQNLKKQPDGQEKLKVKIGDIDEKTKKRIKDIQKQRQQIVNTQNGQTVDEIKNKRFLSEKTQQVDRETIASKIDIFNQGNKGNNVQEKQPSKEQIKNEFPLKNLKLSDIGIRKEKLKSKSLKSGDLIDNHGVGKSSNNDYINDIPLGDTTNLNTVEFKFFGFYSRIRHKLEQFWGVSLREKAEKLYKQGRKLSQNETYITSLQIILNDKGHIVQVKVLGASGHKDLDDAAIESFSRAGPFPNPPRDLLVNGVAVLEWGFVVRS